MRAAALPLLRPAPGFVLGSLGVGLAAIMVLAAGVGAYEVSPGRVLRVLLDGLGLPVGAVDATDAAVLWSIRLPRVALGALVGAALAVSGCQMQGLFRNPLADPALVGVSGGAALAAGAFLVFGGGVTAALGPVLAPAALPLAAFAGGLGATLLALRLARVDGRTRPETLLLAGIAVQALAGAGLGLCQSLADDHTLRSLTFWLLGGLGEATGSTLAWVALPLLAPLLGSGRLAVALDALQLGEAAAGHLGVDVPRLQRQVVVRVAIGVGAAVSACGIIGFVGLAVPHLIRMAAGPGHRVALPACALLGAGLTVAADLVARTAVAPAELPLGVITGLAGAPLFVVLLGRVGRGEGI